MEHLIYSSLITRKIEHRITVVVTRYEIHAGAENISHIYLAPAGAHSESVSLIYLGVSVEVA